MTTATDYPREQRFVENLPVRLTKREMLSKNADLITALDKSKTLKAEKKEAAATFREQEKEIEKEIDQLAECLKSGKERRPVECFQRTRIDERMIDTVRCDTGDIVRSRPMTIDERQLALKELEIRAADTAQAQSGTYHEQPSDGPEVDDDEDDDEEEPDELVEETELAADAAH